MAGTQVNVRFPDSQLHERLRKEADARAVPMNWLIVKLLEEGVERLRPLTEFKLTDQGDRR